MDFGEISRLRIELEEITEEFPHLKTVMDDHNEQNKTNEIEERQQRTPLSIEESDLKPEIFRISQVK